MSSDLRQAVELIGEDLGQIEELLPIAWAIQWDAAPREPLPREDTTERSVGDSVPDPTADVVGDERRLAVRDAVRSAHVLLRRTLQDAAEVRRKLDRAIVAWEGDTGP